MAPNREERAERPAKQHGYNGYNVMLTTTVPEYFRCMICHFILSDPVMIIQCGHKCCNNCFTLLHKHTITMEQELRCPLDRRVINLNQVVKDKGLRRAIESLCVKCGNAEVGCSWEGELSELADHEKNCEAHATTRGGHLHMQDKEVTVVSQKDEETTSKKTLETQITSWKYDILLRESKQDKNLHEDADRKNETVSDGCSDDMTAVTMGQKLFMASQLSQTNEKSEKPKHENTLITLSARFRKALCNGKLNNRISKTKNQKSHQPAAKISLENYIGGRKSTSVNNNIVIFHHLSTVAAPNAFVKPGQKMFYEVKFEGKVKENGGSVSYVGWASPNFKRSRSSDNRCVGWCELSWSFEGQHQMKYHSNSNKTWGLKFEPKEACVLGVAADMVEGKLWYGLNGCWEHPMGIAFEIDTNVRIFPAISAHNINIAVNFGDLGYVFGPPNASFVNLVNQK